MLKSALLWKVLTLIGCLLLLLVPLSMLSALISERASWRDSVAETLSQSTSGPQRVTGPFIVVPWTETRRTMEGKKEVVVEEKHYRYFLPELLTVAAKQRVESRNVGIYQGQVWRTAMTVSARFDAATIGDLLNKPGVTLGQPWVSVMLGDSRGIVSVTSLDAGGESREFQPGSRFGENGEGLHAALPKALLKEKQFTLGFSLTLLGTRELAVVPMGKNSVFELQSNWPHPGFTGDFLPEKRQITAEGFSARWQSSWFANNLNSRFSDDGEVHSLTLPAFSAMVVNPVDQYQQIERAVKYAILLIGLTFMAFFLFETLTALRVHPMQYLLVGLSLVMFFLVLLALAEHIGFNLAWLSASLTCAAINGFYLQAVLRGWRRSLCFIAGLLMLDGVLWQLLQSEESALLLGTGVLVVALAAVMLLTRHIDWYGLSVPVPKRATQPDEPAPVLPDDVPPRVSPADDRDRLWK